MFPQQQAKVLPADMPPILTVVIDTEEEFDWNAPFDPKAISTDNIAHQVLAQAIMDRHGIVPTYVVDYPVASTPSASAVLRAIADDGRCEIGAHLHPWVTPPQEEVVNAFHSYPGNLPASLERRKLATLTACIENAFGRRPTTYKAGRYGLGPASFGILAELGYRLDVSVVGHTDFSAGGGPDFTKLPAKPFKGPHGIGELPLSVHFVGAASSLGPAIFPFASGRIGRLLRLPSVLSRLGLLERLRLSPEGHSLNDMMRQTKAALARGERYFMLTYHSSSLLPGVNSYVRNEAERRNFLSALDGYFSFFLGACGGQTKSITAMGRMLDMG